MYSRNNSICYQKLLQENSKHWLTTYKHLKKFKRDQTKYPSERITKMFESSSDKEMIKYFIMHNIFDQTVGFFKLLIYQ